MSGSAEPLAQFDAVAGGIADLRPGIGLAESWTPDDVDAFGLQIIGGFLHVVDFEGDHAVAEMLVLRGGFDDGTLIGDQLDGGARRAPDIRDPSASPAPSARS